MGNIPKKVDRRREPGVYGDREGSIEDSCGSQQELLAVAEAVKFGDAEENRINVMEEFYGNV